MENQLVQKTFTIDDMSFDCWVIKIGKFWFKAHDIAVFLEDPKKQCAQFQLKHRKVGTN